MEIDPGDNRVRIAFPAAALTDAQGVAVVGTMVGATMPRSLATALAFASFFAILLQRLFHVAAVFARDGIGPLVHGCGAGQAEFGTNGKMVGADILKHPERANFELRRDDHVIERPTPQRIWAGNVAKVPRPIRASR